MERGHRPRFNRQRGAGLRPAHFFALAGPVTDRTYFVFITHTPFHSPSGGWDFR
jgi:hypothetical protein